MDSVEKTKARRESVVCTAEYTSVKSLNIRLQHGVRDIRKSAGRLIHPRFNQIEIEGFSQI